MSSTSNAAGNPSSTSTSARRSGKQRTAPFRAFKALRSLRPDRAVDILHHLRSSRAIKTSSSFLSYLAGKNHQKGQRRAAAKRVVRAAYHSLAALALLPFQYAVATRYPEGQAMASPGTLSLLANAPANAMSRWFGRFAGSPRIPHFIHQRMIAMVIRTYGIDVSEVEKPLSEFRTLQEFFSRKLVPEARLPHISATLVSPCDGEVIRVGKVDADMESELLLQVKGHGYPLTELLHERPAPCRPGYHRWCYIFHLRPKDYHRFHSPCQMSVMKTVHIPGMLHPVTFTAAKWIPHLFSTQERVVVTSEWQHGTMYMVPLGATCVGSISFVFDSKLQTNKTRTLTQLKNLVMGTTIQPPVMGPAVSASSLQSISSSSSKSTNIAWNGENGGWGKAEHRVDEDDVILGGNAFTSIRSGTGSAAPVATTLHTGQYDSPLMKHSNFPSDPTTKTEYAVPSERPTLNRGENMGWFNWGSAIVMVVDLPVGVTPCVGSKDEVRVGQAITSG